MGLWDLMFPPRFGPFLCFSFYDSLLRKKRYFQAELRFCRMFLWCVPDCDANLRADLNSIATSIARFCKIEGTAARSALGYEIEATVGRFALVDADKYNSLATKVEDKIRKCHAGMNKYRQRLMIWSSSLKAEPFTAGNQTIKFLDSVHVSINDLLEYAGDGFPTVKSQIETLEETVFLLRNLVYYTPMGGENTFGFRRKFLLCFSQCVSDANPQTDLIFQFNVHDWANKAACFLLLCWLTKREDEEIRRLYIDLQQKVNPCNPEFIKLCFGVIKVPKMKRVDRLLFGEFVSSIASMISGAPAKATGVFHFPRVSCAAASADDADLDPSVAELPPRPLLEKLARELRRRLGLRLFNLDMIREHGSKDKFYVIDINYFPGYGKMPEYEHIFTDFFLSLVRSK